MKKYFVFSDVHGCYTPLIQELEAKGFDINNPEHILISCGDVFDRGDEVKELINFIKSLPTERRILIRGNHEHLLIDMINKGYAATYDVVNGTLNTILQLTNSTEEEFYSDPQRVILRACMRYNTIFITACRAASKTFLSILAKYLQCVFVPGHNGSIVAPNKNQAARV